MPKTRDRKRVKGSWRDSDKGDCWTKFNAGGGAYVVCKDSAGQQDTYKKKKLKGEGITTDTAKDVSLGRKKSTKKGTKVMGRLNPKLRFEVKGTGTKEVSRRITAGPSKGKMKKVKLPTVILERTKVSQPGISESKKSKKQKEKEKKMVGQEYIVTAKQYRTDFKRV